MHARTKRAVWWGVAAVLAVGLGLVAILRTKPESSETRRAQVPPPQSVEKLIAETGIGRVQLCRGVVGLRTPDQPRWSLAEPGTTLETGTALRAGSDPTSCASVALGDGSHVSFNSSSSVRVAGPGRVEVFFGDAHFRVTKGTPLTVVAPLCTIAVKGTEFDVTVVPGQTRVAVTEGAVEVSAHGQQLSLGPGRSCVVTEAKVDESEAGGKAPWLAKLEGAPEHETLGTLVARVDGKDVPLTVKSHKVTVTIRDQVAYTLIDEEFHNHTGRRLEGTFYYPLPADASISRFAMYVGDTLMEGEMVERFRAREVYESIVRARRDPALLEWMGGNQFKARVFPIEAHSAKRVLLGYTQVLPIERGIIRYTYPLKSEKLTKNPLGYLRIDLDAHSTPGMAEFGSPTHHCQIKTDEHSGRASFEARDYVPSRDFIASYRVLGPKAQLYTAGHWREDDGGYFLAFIAPSAVADLGDSDAQALPADVLLMVDTSASMAGDDFAIARRLVGTLLNFLGDQDRVNLVPYDVEPRLVFPSFVANTAENRQRAAEALGTVEPFGASDLGAALAAAGKAIEGKRETRVIYIGDGVATMGVTEPAELLEAAKAAFADKRVRASVLAIGSEYDQTFVEGFARQFGGVADVVSSSRPLGEIVTDLVADSFRPMVTDLQVSFEGVEVRGIYPQPLPNVRVGGQLVVSGRYDKPGKGRMIVTGLCGLDVWRREIELDLPGEKGANTFLPRLWARRAMDDLLYRIGRGEKALVPQVMDLSLRYRLMSPYTSFLVLETEEDYRRFGIDRRFVMEDWKGGAPTYEGTPGPAARPEASELARGSEPLSKVVPLHFQPDIEASTPGEDQFAWSSEDMLDLDGDRLEDFKSVRMGTDPVFVGTPDALTEGADEWDEPEREPSLFSMSETVPNLRRLGKLVSPPEGGWAGRSYYAGLRVRRGRFYPGQIYPVQHIPQPQPEPEAPKLEPEMRKAIEIFAHGPADFRTHYKLTNFDAAGKHTSTQEETRVVQGTKLLVESHYNGKLSSLVLSDGEHYYTCYEALAHAAGRKLLPQDLRSYRGGLPGFGDSTPEGFAITQGVPTIESRDGNTVILIIEKGEYRWRYFVDAAARLVTKVEYYRRQGGKAFEPQGYRVYDQVKQVAGRPIPMRERWFGVDGKLSWEKAFDVVEIGEAKDVSFAPPEDYLVAVYPLPSSTEARRALEGAMRQDSAHFVLALALAQEGQLDAAARAMEKVVEARPADPYPVLFQGWLRAATGNAQALLAAAERAEKLLAERPVEVRRRLYQAIYTVLNSIGRHHQEAQKYAALLFETAAKGSSERVSWAQNLANAYANQGEPQKGRDLWDTVLAEAPDNGNAWQQFGHFLQNRPEYADEAEAAFLKARELGQDLGTSLAQYYASRGEIGKALPEWRRTFSKYVYAWAFRNFLQNVAAHLGGEAAAQEAERFIADDKDRQRRKQAMLGLLYFLRDDQWGPSDVGEICKRLHDEYPDELNVVREVLNTSRSYYGTYDPLPAIEKRLAEEPKDAADAGQKAHLIQALANYGYGEDAAAHAEKLLARLERPAFEMTARQQAECLHALAGAQQSADPPKALATWQRVLALDLPASDPLVRAARWQVFHRALQTKDFDRARKLLDDTSSGDPDDGNLGNMRQMLISTLYQEKRLDDVVTVLRSQAKAFPQLEYVLRAQVASVLAAQGKAQQACEELWAILLAADAAIERGEMAKHEDYAFRQAGSGLLRLAAKDEALKAKFDKAIAARAGDEKPDGDQRWAALYADLLRARGRLDDLAAHLEKLAARDREGDPWTRRLAAVYAATRQYAKAAALYQKLVEKDPADLYALEQLSRLAEAMNQPAKAREHWEAWLKAVPNEENLLYRLARAAVSRGETEKAIALYERLLDATSRPENYVRYLAEQYVKADRKLDAALAHVRALTAARQPGQAPYNALEQVWPLVTEEGAFTRFVAEVERQAAAATEPAHRARLAALLAGVHARQGNKEKAADWAEKALGDATAFDQAAFQNDLAAVRTVIPAERLVPALQAAVEAAGVKAPTWLRVALAREFFAAGRPAEGEKVFRAAIEAARSEDRPALTADLADLIVGSDLSRALAMLDEIVRRGPKRFTAHALRRKADLMAKAKKHPADEVIAAYRAALEAGDVNERRAAAEGMIAYGSGAGQHEAVFEGYKLLCQHAARYQGDDYLRRLSSYLAEKRLDARAEDALRQCIEALRADPYHLIQAWRVFGEFFANRDEPGKAVRIWAEGLAATPGSLNYRHNRHNLLDAIFSAFLHGRNKDRVDKALVSKLILDEVDLRLKGRSPNQDYWPGYFWQAAQTLDLTNDILARFKALPDNERAFGRAYRLIADAYRQHFHDPDNALKYYRMAVASGRQDDRVHALDQIVAIHRQASRWGDALEALAQLLEQGGSAHRLGERGFFLAKLGRADEALKAYEEASKQAGLRVHAYGQHRELGSSASEAGLHDFATKELRLALRLHDFYRRGRNRDDSHVSECYRLLAKAYLGKGEPGKAVDELLTGLTRLPENYRSGLMSELIAFYRDSPKLDELVADYERAAAASGAEKPMLRAVFGDIYREKGNLAAALRHYEAALEVAPSRNDIRQRVVEILRKRKQDAELLVQLRQQIAYDPKNLAHYRELGGVLTRAGRPADALRAYTTMLEAMPTEADSHREMAGVYTAMSRHADAVTMWKKVVQYRPEEPQSHYGLAESYVRSSQPDQARRVYQSMLTMSWDRRFGDVKAEASRRLDALERRSRN
ncbi:MAG TPA: VIT domain-containing protein [Planctomycetota bacterium]|nr:VIT domain-containing protein [Planctomycetota bacterium]